MEPKTLVFNKSYIIKSMFHRCVTPSTTNKLDIKKTVQSTKDSHCNKGAFKYFIGYIGNSGIIPLCIIFLKLTHMLNILIKTANT